MSVIVSILCENSVGRPGRLIGEHGFSCLVETPRCKLLFDTGQGLGLLHNAAELGVNLAELDGVALSHGHYDHAGGLAALLAARAPLTVWAHPDIFLDRYWRSEFESRPIGNPNLRPDLEERGAVFSLDRGFRELATGVWFSGEIPRTNDFEKGDPHLVVPSAGGFSIDPLLDDQALILDSGKGLVLLCGCAHAGLVNTMQHAFRQTGRDRIHAVIGGTHLGPADDAQFSSTRKALRDLGVERVATSHCTGLQRSAQLQREFGGRFAFAAVGSRLEF
ncbi:MAG: hypothetical protein A2091_06955 [Desulfuromonadales bacterium GWD2_61_12]|nr:MAG: hypothetical protein A2091_06955 [Desulfuromonadales bacterium GWD2_61_12]OGR33322.1 MAG: hypothetical protein A2005_01725 [Desulfuromonadales bacterium GWC2_61_20]HAD03702.1 MBL fold metallo-hydrolase [Desulfuromonas sp.]HBT82411.1 MBL fold metallo-hydrolase [Desulfuromonas sp.]